MLTCIHTYINIHTYITYMYIPVLLLNNWLQKYPYIHTYNLPKCIFSNSHTLSTAILRPEEDIRFIHEHVPSRLVQDGGSVRGAEARTFPHGCRCRCLILLTRRGWYCIVSRTSTFRGGYLMISILSAVAITKHNTQFNHTHIHTYINSTEWDVSLQNIYLLSALHTCIGRFSCSSALLVKVAREL